ncbi:choice-of-anchor H family protein [Shewanella sp. OMA3-2]|uniref:choice-of-anchor H family protein n=1 Tax=Shewanella sp. OMA3-2 TaxID=2908650 RepID=UPI001F404915|nr:choice-of-anchor H family protein [Shewanella sp. OMA3-2]UJF21342.1 choice-of-anchor H family protein [Shewanella sp. OMA3-2]
MKSNYLRLATQAKNIFMSSMIMGSVCTSAIAENYVLTPAAVSEGRVINNQDPSIANEDRKNQIEKLKQGVKPLNKNQSADKILLIDRDARIAAYQQGTIALPELKLSELTPQKLTQPKPAQQEFAPQTAASRNSIKQSQMTQTQVQQVQKTYLGYRDFTVYQAHSRLFDDIDQDGFYQTFSVTFDADVYGYTVNEPANVYAEMYLSRNGGPWEHYYTTDVFTIYGESDDDDFEVLTTLRQGYKTDYYDVLIDLYEYGYNDVVATLSADESDGLYALPLESSDRDIIYQDVIVEEVVIVEGGSLSWTVLLLLFAGLFSRKTISLKNDQ